MYYVEKNFFGYVFGRSLSGRAIQGFRPHRSSTLQVRPSLAMLQVGSDSIVPPSLSSTLQVRPSLAMLQNGSDSLAPLLSLTQ